MMTPEQKKEYLEGKGSKCPFCQSGNIMGQGMQPLGPTTVGEDCECGLCERQWQDRFTLTGVEYYDEAGDLQGVPDPPEEITVTLNIAQGPPAPHEEQPDTWKPYSFCRSHVNFIHPLDPKMKIAPNGHSGVPELEAKLKSGLAFILTHFEHGECLWSIASLQQSARGCPFDQVSVAGVLIWEGPEDHLGAKKYEDRKRDAGWFVGEYTDWCNGAVYDIVVSRGNEELEGHNYIPDSALDSSIRDLVHPHTKGEKNVNVEGDAAWLAQYHNLIPSEPVETPPTKDSDEPSST